MAARKGKAPKAEREARPAPQVGLSEAARAAAREFGRLGAMAAHRSRSPEERRALARKAIRTRWKRYYAKREAERGKPS